MHSKPSTVALIIPTLNAEKHLEALIPAIQALTPAPKRVLVIDSSSEDKTVLLCKHAGFDVHVIERADFGHGKTRNLGARLCKDSDILVYLTQDAIPACPEMLAKLVAPLEDKAVGVTYGRQLPHTGATLPARFARAFNYPEKGHVTTKEDIPIRGLKAMFCSNSCAAYNRKSLQKVGGFPEHLPLAEDLAVTGRMLEAGYKSVYAADATVHHSHDYTYGQEFKRYFDIGALLQTDSWLKERKLKSGGEGVRYVTQELSYTWNYGNLFDVMGVLCRTAAKYTGFQLGKNCHRLPVSFVKKCSMHHYFWASDTRTRTPNNLTKKARV